AEVQEMLELGQITFGHAKLLKGMTDQGRQVAVAKEIVARGLSVAATDALLKQGGDAPLPPENTATPKAPKAPVEKTAHVKSIEDELRQKVGLKIEIKVKAKEKGQILLSFENNDDFERAVELLRK